MLESVFKEEQKPIQRDDRRPPAMGDDGPPAHCIRGYCCQRSTLVLRTSSYMSCQRSVAMARWYGTHWEEQP